MDPRDPRRSDSSRSSHSRDLFSRPQQRLSYDRKSGSYSRDSRDSRDTGSGGCGGGKLPLMLGLSTAEKEHLLAEIKRDRKRLDEEEDRKRLGVDGKVRYSVLHHWPAGCKYVFNIDMSNQIPDPSDHFDIDRHPLLTPVPESYTSTTSSDRYDKRKYQDISQSSSQSASPMSPGDSPKRSRQASVDSASNVSVTSTTTTPVGSPPRPLSGRGGRYRK
ncbi:hypothetical protein HK098_003285 [Nowakowskiella sp. JEL0407]|nr:hypothetical protein HK098_003285 [Nowakowskiella sp. JEL0407]